MSFDLTNKNIQDTFQNLLQQTGSTGEVYDLEGNQVTDLSLTNISASGNISSSGGLIASYGQFDSVVQLNEVTYLQNIFETERIFGTQDEVLNTYFGKSHTFKTGSTQIALINSDGLTVKHGNISGSSTSTGSFGHIKINGENIKTFISSSAAADGFSGGNGGGGGISNIVDDTTPQLGGDLDLNGNNITGNGRLFLGGAASISTTTPAPGMELTVEGDISASGNVFADGFIVGPQGTTRAGTTALTVAGDISGSGAIQSTGDISTDGDLNILNNKKLKIDGGDTFVQLSDNTIQIDGDNQVNLSGDIHIKLNTPTIKVEGDISSSNAITSSKVLVNAPNATDDFFLLKSGSLDSIKVNSQGVLQLGGFTFQPTAVRGGIYYNENEDEFFIGKNN